MRGFQYQAFTKSVLKVYEKKSIAQELHNINIIPHTSNGQKKIKVMIILHALNRDIHAHIFVDKNNVKRKNRTLKELAP